VASEHESRVPPSLGQSALQLACPCVVDARVNRDACGVLAVPESQQEDSKALRNQFNFSERAAQTQNNPYRDRHTSTEPPPTAAFSASCTQVCLPTPTQPPACGGTVLGVGTAPWRAAASSRGESSACWWHGATRAARWVHESMLVDLRVRQGTSQQ
jgi:hypothetical protein